MLSDNELLQYLAIHRPAEAARRCILDTRNSNPFRAVRSGDKQNICTAFASRKMGRSINTESGTSWPLLLSLNTRATCESSGTSRSQ